MSLSDDLGASPAVALAFATALEQALGDDALLTVGETRATIGEIVGEEATRVVAAQYTVDDNQAGRVAFVALEPFAEALERAASDELLLTSCAAALQAAIDAIAEVGGIDIEAEPARLSDRAALDEHENIPTLIAYPILDGGDVAGCLAVYVAAAAAGAARPAGAGPAAEPTAPASATAGAPGAFVLADVEMGVTAELGRCRMTVRELLSITPGTVIDLDRAAGAPVDVLVNGTPIARGEVVVIDEEFGIRISEILPQPSATH